jgi:hypothetical protein
MRSSVVWPAPFGPTSADIQPSRTFTVQSLCVVTRLYLLVSPPISITSVMRCPPRLPLAASPAGATRSGRRQARRPAPAAPLRDLLAGRHRGPPVHPESDHADAVLFRIKPPQFGPAAAPTPGAGTTLKRHILLLYEQHVYLHCRLGGREWRQAAQRCPRARDDIAHGTRIGHIGSGSARPGPGAEQAQALWRPARFKTRGCRRPPAAGRQGP